VTASTSAPTSTHPAWSDDADELAVAVDRLPGLDLVAAVGELDLLTAPRLRSVLLEPAVCAQPVLVVDLSALAFIDSTGLGTLIETERSTRARGARLVLVVPPGTVAARVLAIAGLDAVFTTSFSLTEALGQTAA
jgi:anti-sigma B factor antagonist